MSSSSSSSSKEDGQEEEDDRNSSAGRSDHSRSSGSADPRRSEIEQLRFEPNNRISDYNNAAVVDVEVEHMGTTATVPDVAISNNHNDNSKNRKIPNFRKFLPSLKSSNDRDESETSTSCTLCSCIRSDSGEDSGNASTSCTLCPCLRSSDEDGGHAFTSCTLCQCFRRGGDEEDSGHASTSCTLCPCLRRRSDEDGGETSISCTLCPCFRRSSDEDNDEPNPDQYDAQRRWTLSRVNVQETIERMRTGHCTCIRRSSEDEGRQRWRNEYDFLMSCMGFSVGLGNVWRFPYLCYKHGGGVFLIPYMISVICATFPMLFLESILGQMMQRGAIQSWNIVPIMKGMGVTQVLIIFSIACYYIVILSWTLFYVFSSMTSVLPWSHCNNPWNSENCTTLGAKINSNDTNSSKTFDSSLEFWEKRVLGISYGLHDMGTVRWDLSLCLLLAWVIVFFCIFRGVKSSGRVVYVTVITPYIFMFILLIKAATLPGAAIGLKYYMIPDISELGKSDVWADAGTQAFFSMSITMATYPALGSHNDKRHNTLRDCLLYTLIDTLTSIIAGFVIFMSLGYMALVKNVDISKVATSGPGLAFIVYPESLATMPGAPVWSVFFFTMLFLLGLDSEFIAVQGFLTGIIDFVPHFLKSRDHYSLTEIIVCVVCFLIGLPMITNGGMYVFQLFDYFTGGSVILFLIGCIQCLAIAYVHGVDTFNNNITEKLQCWYPSPMAFYFKFMWCIGSPIFTLVIFIMSVVRWSPPSYTVETTGHKYVFPPVSVGLGWTVTVLIVVPILAIAVYKVVIKKYRNDGTFCEIIRSLMVPRLSEDCPLFSDDGGRSEIEVRRDQYELDNVENYVNSAYAQESSDRDSVEGSQNPHMNSDEDVEDGENAYAYIGEYNLENAYVEADAEQPNTSYDEEHVGLKGLDNRGYKA